MGRPKNFSRDEVLEKAMSLFWRQGFADTSLQDLEKVTGVNKSGLYSEFESKEDLFLESLKHYISVRDGKALLSEPLGWHNLETFFKNIQVCSSGQKGCFAINSMRELAVLPPEARDIVMKNLAGFKRLILKNVMAEHPKMDPDAVADLVVTFFIGICLEQNLNTKKAAAPGKIEDLMRALRLL